jgi:hypothetical protein
MYQNSRRMVGASAPVPDLRSRRLLRRLAEQACDQAFSRHATSVIEGYDPPEGWGWCYVDEVFLDLGDDVTPQRGPIKRFVR